MSSEDISDLAARPRRFATGRSAKLTLAALLMVIVAVVVGVAVSDHANEQDAPIVRGPVAPEIRSLYEACKSQAPFSQAGRCTNPPVSKLLGLCARWTPPRVTPLTVSDLNPDNGTEYFTGVTIQALRAMPLNDSYVACGHLTDEGEQWGVIVEFPTKAEALANDSTCTGGACIHTPIGEWTRTSDESFYSIDLYSRSIHIDVAISTQYGSEASGDAIAAYRQIGTSLDLSPEDLGLVAVKQSPTPSPTSS
jgi:hypothetical protein